MKPTLSYEQAHAFFSELFYGEQRIPSTIEPYRLNGWALTVDDVIGGDLASYDYDALTRLVFMAHDRCIRVAIWTGRDGIRAGARAAHHGAGWPYSGCSVGG